MQDSATGFLDDPALSLIAGPAERPSLMRPLSIAVINNMPDAALRAAERQICSVLAAASDGMVVDVTFYNLGAMPRSPQARAHIASYYENINDLFSNVPDGLIVTGAEPCAQDLADEPFWRPLCRVIDWSEEQGVPAIWSCLAAHAAVRHLDGIERRRLPQKLSGLFTASSHTGRHQILHRMPRKWVVPHSRWNGLDRGALDANGYTVLSSAGTAGVDMFIKQAPVLQVFLQGHLEYEPATLLAEYRRDLLRAAAAACDCVPDLPDNIADRPLAEQIRQQAKRFVIERRSDVLPRLDLLLRAAKPPPVWAPVAQALFRNWLSHLEVCRVRPVASNPSFRPGFTPARAQAADARRSPVSV